MEATLWSLFPVFTILSLQRLSPLVALAWSTVFASVFFAIMLSIRHEWRRLLRTAAWGDILMTAAILGILYYVLYFFGLRTTSAGNAGIVALTEIFFSFLFFHVWQKQFIPKSHVIGAACMLGGAGIVLYPSITGFHVGDLLILGAAAVAPFGNFFQLRARQVMSSYGILFIRTTLSIPFLFLFASVFTGGPMGFDWRHTFPYLIINGFVLLGLSKVFWIEGIHRISVTKANALSCISPVLTLLFAFVILRNHPTAWQLTSLLPMLIGIILLSRNPKPTAAAAEARTTT